MSPSKQASSFIPVLPSSNTLLAELPQCQNMADSGELLLRPETHVGLFPSAGMGHLIPFLRLAALLVRHHCRVTLITTHPTVSLAESNLVSRFLSAFPQVSQVSFDLLPLDPSTVNSTDPFWIRFETIRRSAVHSLFPLLSSLSSPPLSVLVYDVSIASGAGFVSAFGDVLEIPGISPVPRSSIPPLLLVPDSLFAHIFFTDSAMLNKVDGILINTFKELEPGALEALNNRKQSEQGFPPVFAVGPFERFEFEDVDQCHAVSKWLDEQPEESVVYVSFGSRTAQSRDQLRELGEGLVKCGYRFLWVVKDKIVDKDEEEGVEMVVGEELMDKMKDKGLVVKHWVDQEKILSHKAVGGFVSHSGPNSMIEAVIHGVRILAWPQNGDQRICADVVEESGAGMWARSWGWGGDGDHYEVVKRDEIAEKVRELMESQSLKVKIKRLQEAAKKAAQVGGVRSRVFMELIEMWKMKNLCI
ncbi:hypothetical protein FNV43_RR26278 [Rhamnella rubrinervis]|uniref:Glycosyltransferase n=1 Tax=Rhamnella rubrinervis TaxID=2594499 RepID=A0A8K0GJH2_9ROSA|nr:hypothetical protein FNV43_RR26278 [Rhamnella rubrinervis]